MSFHAKIRILENISAIVSLTASHYLKDCTTEIDSNINDCDFWYCVLKCVNVWKSHVTQWNQSLQMTNACDVTQSCISKSAS